MSERPPVTQRDVARACGVHPSTICLALNNAPSIPLATRQRVQAAAATLGYRPNVAARNLALLRSDKPGSGSLPIAWINQEESRHHWRTEPRAAAALDSARRRADELGYHLEEIWAREPGMTATRLVQIIQARGIDGVLLPVHRAFEFSLLTAAWNDFAMVGVSDHRLSEWVDVVCPDYYRDAETVFRQARQLDLGRVGLALTAQTDAASHGLVHSCYLRHQAELSGAERVPACFLTDSPEDRQRAFEEWLHEHQPAVVVTGESAFVSRARAAGFQATWLGLGSAAAPFDGGVDDVGGRVAAAAVDCVVDKIRRFEKGLRDATRIHLLKSAWAGPRVARLEPETVVA